MKQQVTNWVYNMTGLYVMFHALNMTFQSDSIEQITWDKASTVKPDKFDKFRLNQIYS